jgi:hypothetical protein
MSWLRKWSRPPAETLWFCLHPAFMESESTTDRPDVTDMFDPVNTTRHHTSLDSNRRKMNIRMMPQKSKP